MCFAWMNCAPLLFYLQQEVEKLLCQFAWMNCILWEMCFASMNCAPLYSVGNVLCFWDELYTTLFYLQQEVGKLLNARMNYVWECP